MQDKEASELLMEATINKTTTTAQLIQEIDPSLEVLYYSEDKIPPFLYLYQIKGIKPLKEEEFRYCLVCDGTVLYEDIKNPFNGEIKPSLKNCQVYIYLARKSS